MEICPASAFFCSSGSVSFLVILICAASESILAACSCFD